MIQASCVIATCVTFLTNQTIWKSVENSVNNSTLSLWSTSYLHRCTCTPASASPVPRWRRFRHVPPQSMRRLRIYVYGLNNVSRHLKRHVIHIPHHPDYRVIQMDTFTYRPDVSSSLSPSSRERSSSPRCCIHSSKP